jgi:hypothetical protein
MKRQRGGKEYTGTCIEEYKRSVVEFLTGGLLIVKFQVRESFFISLPWKSFSIHLTAGPFSERASHFTSSLVPNRQPTSSLYKPILSPLPLSLQPPPISYSTRPLTNTSLKHTTPYNEAHHAFPRRHHGRPRCRPWSIPRRLSQQRDQPSRRPTHPRRVQRLPGLVQQLHGLLVQGLQSQLLRRLSKEYLPRPPRGNVTAILQRYGEM